MQYNTIFETNVLCMYLFSTYFPSPVDAVLRRRCMKHVLYPEGAGNDYHIGSMGSSDELLSPELSHLQSRLLQYLLNTRGDNVSNENTSASSYTTSRQQPYFDYKSAHANCKQALEQVFQKEVSFTTHKDEEEETEEVMKEEEVKGLSVGLALCLDGLKPVCEE
jgi:hypothetical protein